jgi:hypothetical protein
MSKEAIVWRNVQSYLGKGYLVRSMCITGNQSSALFIFPSHKITLFTVYILLNKCSKHCFMHECQMRGTILGLVWYVSRLTVRICAPPNHITGVWWELPLPPFPYAAMVDLLKINSEQQFVSTLNRCLMDLWQSVGSHPSSSPST